MTPQSILVLVVLTLASAAPARAWSDKGHRIVAMIASNRLAPAARAQVKALLADDPDGRTLPAVAAWADDVKKTTRPETERWHYVNIPLSDRPVRFDAGRDCRFEPGRGDCIVNAVERLLAALADRQLPAAKRRDALKFVTHLVGDLHQPLHCASRDGDRGGNDVDVVFLGEPGWNLHSVWDVALIARSGLSQNKYVEKLTHWLRTQDTVRMAAGTPADWANESHALALSHVYRTATGRPVVNRTKLDARYVAAVNDVLEQQLARGGVRLAAVLNRAMREEQ